MLLIGVFAIAGALGLGVFLVMTTVVTPEGLFAGRLTKVRAPRERASGPGQLPALSKRMAALAGKLTPTERLAKMQHRLDLAGNPRSWGPDRVLAIKGFGLIGGAAVGFLFGARFGPVGAILALAGVAVAGFLLPDVLVRNAGQKRQDTLQRGLPDALDILTICVEAGLGFDSAIGRVARNLEGPMGEEFARVLQEMQFGMSRSEALRSLANRTDVPELRGFVAAIVQSSELGVSIGDVLRAQGKEMRIKRRQRAEEKAQKLQVKLLLPLITCLLPAMFIVVLGPAVLQMMAFFRSTGA